MPVSPLWKRNADVETRTRGDELDACDGCRRARSGWSRSRRARASAIALSRSTTWRRERRRGTGAKLRELLRASRRDPRSSGCRSRSSRRIASRAVGTVQPPFASRVQSPRRRRSRRAPRAPSRPPRPATRCTTLPSNGPAPMLLDHARAVAGDLERRGLARARDGPAGGRRSTRVSATSVRTAPPSSERERHALGASAGVPERHLDAAEDAPRRRARRPTACAHRRDAAPLGLVERRGRRARSGGRGGATHVRPGPPMRSRRVPPRRRRSRPRRPSS